MSRIRIITPSRLHFGLFGWGPTSPRQFGGVGLMVDEPGLEILVEPSDRWETAGPLSDRALGVARDVAKRLLADNRRIPPVRLQVVRAPAAHVGLGVGTQLSLAVARALTELACAYNTSVDILARLTGRGRRSGIGIHGFGEGGLIVDGGRTNDREVPTRLLRLALPPGWSVLLVIPDRGTGLSGPAESNAFEALPAVELTTTDRLCRLVLLGLLPAVVESNLFAFGQSLTEIQEIVGSAFAPVQGGRFACPKSVALLGRMKQLGLTGVGQSSWGPTLYAFTDASPDDRDAMRKLLLEEFQMSGDRVLWTRGSESGARWTIETN